MALNEAYQTGLEVIRKEYKATIRNRSGKLYLMVKWPPTSWMPWNGLSGGGPTNYEKASTLVKEIWPSAYTTSAGLKEATFRLNP